MPLGMEVGLGSRDIVLDGTQILQKGTAAPPLLGQSIVAKRLDGSIKYATWYGGRPRPRRHCVIWGPSSPPPKGAQQPPLLGPCLLWQKG